jgi:hypothetical protein
MNGRLIACLIAIAVMSGCTAQQADNIVNFADQWASKIDNFNRAASAVNINIVAKTSATVAGYCTQAKSVGTNLTKIASPNTVTMSALVKVTAGLTDFCAAPPADVASAVALLAQAIADAKSAGG